MKTLRAWILLVPLIALCVVGLAAALLRLRRLDEWCLHRLDEMEKSS
jgi:hypothetical protein